MQIDINTDAAVVFSDILERIGKSALPNAVRETLSKTALDVKQKTMPKTTEAEFTNRRKNFFKANSVVDFAKGKDINSMRSTVGFNSQKLTGGNNFAVKDLEQQEYGGKIEGRNFIPLDPARTGNNRDRNVSVRNRMNQIKNIVFAGSSRGVGKRRVAAKKQRWIRAAFKAKSLYGNNAFVMGNIKQGRQTLSRIDSISSSYQGRKLQIKRTPVYSFKRGGIQPIKGRGFMKRAAYESRLKMNDIYINEARKQIDHYLGILMK